MRLLAALLDVLLELLLVLALVPEPVVPQAVSAISTAVAAIGRNMFDAPVMIEEVIRVVVIDR